MAKQGTILVVDDNKAVLNALETVSYTHLRAHET